MPAKTTVVRRARFNYSGFSAEQMLNIGTELLGSIKNRIRSARNAEDQPAMPLKAGGRSFNGGYPAAKARRGIPPLRNWIWTGGTMAQMIVKEVSQNRGVIGFATPRADTIAHFNNIKEKAFGVSPIDREALRSSVYLEASVSIGVRSFATHRLSSPDASFTGPSSFAIPSRRAAVLFNGQKRIAGSGLLK